MDHAIRRQHIGWGRFTVQFENKITTGGVIQLIVMVGGIMAFLLGYEHRMTMLESASAQQLVRMSEQDQTLRLIQQQLQGRVVPATTPP